MNTVFIACVGLAVFAPKAECAVTAWTEPVIATASGSGVFSTSPVNEKATYSVTVVATAGSPATYTLGTKTPDVAWAITSPAGVLSIAAGILDYETSPTYVVEVVGTDSTASTATCTLSITNLNVVPAFSATSLTATIADAAAAGTAVATYAVTNPDTDTVTYSIASGDCNSDFSIVAATGAVSVATGKTMAAATTPCYSLVLNGVNNNVPPSTGSTTVLVTVGSSTCSGTYACAGAATVIAGIMTVSIGLFITIMK